MESMRDITRLITGANGDRRAFLKGLAAVAAGSALGSAGMTGCASRRFTGVDGIADGTAPEVGPAKVSLVAGNDRRDMVYRAMKPFEDEIAAAIEGRQVIVKLNCVGQNGHPLMVTHPDAVRGVLDFLEPIYGRKVVIAESTVQNKNPEKTFDIFGYRPLEREYDAKIVELNDMPATRLWILDKDLYPAPIRIIDTFLDPRNYFISVTRLKTHNCAVATLTLKNMVMGSPLKIPRRKINEKVKMHANGPGNKSPKMINLNLFLMAHRVRPDFSVLDGFEGVEGNGPAHGDPVDHRVCLAGPDFLAVDRIGTELMGIPWDYMGYLRYCATAGLGQGDRDRIGIIGPDPGNHVVKYRLHDNIDWQLAWMKDLVLEEGK